MTLTGQECLFMIYASVSVFSVRHGICHGCTEIICIKFDFPWVIFGSDSTRVPNFLDTPFF